jgi:hypothetical protein
MTLTPEDLAAIRQAIREELAAAAGKSAVARIVSLSETPGGETPEDLLRRLRDLEVKALLAEVREESPAVVELKSRIRNLEARVTLLEKGPAA